MAVPKRKVSKSKSLIRLFNKNEVSVDAFNCITAESLNLLPKSYSNKLKRFDSLNKKKFRFSSFLTRYSFFKLNEMSKSFFKLLHS